MAPQKEGPKLSIKSNKYNFKGAFCKQFLCQRGTKDLSSDTAKYGILSQSVGEKGLSGLQAR
jgi:hypothetical protein